MGRYFSFVRKKIPFNLLLKLICSLMLFVAGLGLRGNAQNLTKPNIDGFYGLQVNSYSGSLYYQRGDLYIPGRGLSLNISFSYNSANRYEDYGFGHGWSFELNLFYDTLPNKLYNQYGEVTAIIPGIHIHRGDGRSDFYKGGTQNPKGIFDVLTKSGSTYILTSKDGVKYYFENPTHKKITRITERNGNEIKFSYDGSNQLNTATDASGRVVTFTWNGNHLREARSEAASPAHSIKYNYDNAGNLIAVQDALGQIISYEYGAEWAMIGLTDANGNKAGISFNANRAVSSIVTCLEKKEIVYDYNNKKTQVFNRIAGTSSKNPLSVERTLQTTYSFDNDGKLISRTGNCCGFSNKYTYDADNNITGITDANGNKTIYGYDKKGNLLSETDPLGRSIFYTYDASFNQVTSVTDKRSNKTIFKYDSHGNLTEKDYPLNIVVKYGYDDKGNLTSFTDGRGKLVTYVPDEYGYVKSRTDSAGTANYVYDAWGNLLSVKDANQHETKYSYDLINQLAEIKNAKGFVTKYYYDKNGNVERMADANGHETTYQYDPYDNLILIEDALHHTTAFNYDGTGSMLDKIDANGHTSFYKYDNLNRLISEKNALGETTAYSYDGNGNKISASYPNGNTVYAEYDALNRATKITDQLGVLVSYEYDANSNKTSQSNGIGNTTTFKYDALNRLISEVDPLGNVTTYQYDNNNNLVQQNDRNDNPMYYYYDALNRMTGSKDALNNINKYGYDPVGNQLSVTDAKTNTTTYSYDELNRKTQEQFADLTIRKYAYDSIGNLVSRTDNNGAITYYKYDDVNRLTFRQYPGAAESFTYDAEGKMLTAANKNAVDSFSYDKADRILSETLNGKTTSYAYNIPGKTKTITYPGGRTIQRNMDGRNHLVSIAENGGAIASFIYNSAGQNTSRIFANGTTNTFNYTGRGQLDDLAFGPTHVNDVDYSYDKEGNPSAAVYKTQAAEQYGYDNINRLKSFTKTGSNQSFMYDGVGNRTTAVINGANVTYAVNKMNAYTGITTNGNTVTPAYDANGNTTAYAGNNYDYDNENRITVVNNGTTATYKYDALGRRIYKATATDTIHYYFDGLQAIEERNNKDSIIASYVWGTWLDDIVAMSRNNNIYYYTTNLIGSVTSVSDTSGKLVERYAYDPFGKQTIYDANNVILLVSAVGNTYLFTGRQIDKETGLYYFRARYYDAVTGRFLQRDPLGYVDGLGLYAYVNNNPLSSFDPIGTEGIDWCEVNDFLNKAKYYGSEFWEGFSDAVVSDAKDLLRLATDENYRHLVWENLKDLTVKDVAIGFYNYATSINSVRDFGGLFGHLALAAVGPKGINLAAKGAGYIVKGTIKGVESGLNFLTKDAKAIIGIAETGGSSAQYSVAFETKLASNLYPGKGYYSHFKAANVSLNNAMASDATFANSMTELGISIPRSPTGSILGKSPAGWVWHHDIYEGVMQLVPKTQHTFGSRFWDAMHPNGIGGMSIWGK
ncbi:MAG TPA: RHS repeat-associated core domain-containing protein [Parafilimonas sp.]|nr:RHS repeat-associated core domain-containing protein [Parafilimonas sp.]